MVCVSFPMIFVRGYVLCLLIYSICYHIFHQPLFEASSIKILLEHTINVTYPCPHTPTPLPSLTLCYHQTHPHPHTHPHPYPLSHHVTTKLTITTRYVPSQDCVSAPRWAVLWPAVKINSCKYGDSRIFSMANISLQQEGWEGKRRVIIPRVVVKRWEERNQCCCRVKRLTIGCVQVMM